MNSKAHPVPPASGRPGGGVGHSAAAASGRPGGGVGHPVPAAPGRPGGGVGHPAPAAPGRPGGGLGHPLRAALLGLLARRDTLTSTEAARELGESSGACSFHLRQLERYGQIEPVPGQHGRARPWRLVSAPPTAPAADEFGELARELENEGYRRWLAGRDTAPPGWHDEAFSSVVHLTPEELTTLAQRIQEVISSFADRSGAGPEESTMPVAVVARLFPLLPAGPP